jgi:hypothetical protein
MTNKEALAKAEACLDAIEQLALSHGMTSVSFGVAITGADKDAFAVSSYGEPAMIGKLVLEQVEYYEHRAYRNGPMEHGEKAPQA